MKNNEYMATIRTSDGFETIDLCKFTEDAWDSFDIVRIGNRQLKPYLYVREFDLRYLTKEDVQKYGIQPKIYKYIGVSSEENFRIRTAKWVYRSKNNNNQIGCLLRQLETMFDTRGCSTNINDYVTKNSRILNYFDTIEQAKEYEKSLIGIIQLEQEQWDLDTVCLNINDKPLEVTDIGYVLRKNIRL